MKPFKPGKRLSGWLLRIALVASLYNLYGNILSAFVLSNITFLLALCIFIFGLLVFIGGFLTKPTLTVVSGLGITGITIYKIFISFNGLIYHILPQLIPLAIGFYFFSNGNDQ